MWVCMSMYGSAEDGEAQRPQDQSRLVRTPSIARVAAPPRRTACQVEVLSVEAVRRLKKGRNRD